MKTCCVLGLGYIGLPLSGTLANNGYKVIGVDINNDIIKKVNKGNIHIIEKDLQGIINKAVKSGNLVAKSKPVKSDIFIIAVPTPFKKEFKDLPSPDITFVLDAAKSIANVINKDNLVLIESTCPVGTTERVKNCIEKYSKIKNIKFDIAYCPERVIPGQILKELISNDRIVGGYTEISTSKGIEFYKSFCKGKILATDTKTAELVKLTENSYRDLNIAFANEISMICDDLNVNVSELIKLSNHHPRVNILSPGCGVGGHCIAVDPWFIASEFPDKTKLIQASRKVNIEKTQWVIRKIIKESNNLSKKLGRLANVACLGLSFKPDVDDTRESPSIEITKSLISNNLYIYPCEPHIKNFSEFKLYSLEQIEEKADLYVFLVAHTIFKNLDLKDKIYLDFCGITAQK